MIEGGVLPVIGFDTVTLGGGGGTYSFFSLQAESDSAASPAIASVQPPAGLPQCPALTICSPATFANQSMGAAPNHAPKDSAARNRTRF